jgi:ATP-dependent helicase/nuclease subunit B
MQTAVAHFERLYLDEIAEFGARATDLAHERPLAQRLGAWLYDYETRRRPGINRLFLEKEGQLVFQTGSGPFTLTAKSDRLELDSNGHVHIIDFKTGSPPSEKQVKQGYSPQLTLTAAIVEAGGFNPIGKKEAGDLTYVKVTGRKPAGVETRVDKAEASSIMAKTALEGLVRLIERYDDPTSVYAASTLTGTKNRIDDYLHLSRRREWGLSAEADSDSEP